MRWAQEHDASLRGYVAGNLSCSQIANEISAEYKITVSRNAVIGRIHRLGLQTVPIVRALRREKAQRPRRVSLPRQKPIPEPARFICEPVTGLRQADVIPLNISIYELNDQTCHWPYGETPPFAYCGHLVFGDGPYCESHGALARNDQPSRSQRAKIARAA
jgi:hypothetical protein